MKFLNVLALLLIVIGALNWGLWGFFQFDFVAWLCGGNTTGWARLIYAVIGLAGVWSLRFICRCRHLCCQTESCSSDKGSKGSGSGCCKM